MYSPQIHKLLIESRSRDLNHVAASRRAPQLLTRDRPRRRRVQSARPSLVARFAI